MAYQPPFSGKRISLKADSNTPIEKGVVTLASGTDITLDQTGSIITISGSGEGTGGGDVEAVGVIKMYAGSTAPVGWHLCDGSAVSRETYADLFAVIGETYGAGDGSTTFNLPNLKGRFPVGKDNGQTEFDNLGETGGEKEHLLTVGEMPSHTHTQDAHTHTQNSHNHTQNAHTHTQNSHNHTQDAHTHTQASHTHTMTVSGSPAVGATASAQLGGGGTWAATGTILGIVASTETPTINSATATNQATTATNQNTTATNQATTATNQNTTATNQNTGGDEAHNNLPPYVTVNFIIKMVSEAVGDGSITAEYVRAELGTDQTTNVSADDHVKFDVVDASNGGSILLDTSTAYTNGAGDSVGRFTLAPDKTYSLRATIPRVLFGGSSAYLQYQWYNVTDAEYIGTKGAALPFTWSASNVSNYPYAEAIISPTAQTVVELRLADAFSVSTIGGNSIMPSALVQMIKGVGVGGEGGNGNGNGLSAIFNVSTQTSNYTVTTDDTMVLADATSGSVTITLPLASSAEGYRFYIKRIDNSGNSVSIARSGSDTIDGGTSTSITGQWTVVGAVSNGANWFLI